MSPVRPAGALPTEFDPSRRLDVVGLGESSIDHLCVVERFPAPDEKLELGRYELQGGGQIATAMVACARLGLSAAYLGAVGDDALGALVREGLASETVEVEGIVTVPGAATRVAFILVTGGPGTAGPASRTVLFRRDPRLSLPLEAYGDAVLAGRVLHLDATVPETAIAAAERARQASVVVTLDIDHAGPGAEALVAACDVVVCSEAFPAQLVGTSDPAEGLRRLARLTPAFLCVTLGERGSLALIDGEPHLEPAFRVPVVDTTGAGDIYHAAFIYGMLRRWPAPDVMRFANAAAALKCRRLGGRPGAPAAAEVAALLLRQPQV